MKYRVVTVKGKTKGYKAQFKPKFWPFWFDLHRCSYLNLTSALEEIGDDIKKSQFKKEILYETEV